MEILTISKKCVIILTYFLRITQLKIYQALMIFFFFKTKKSEPSHLYYEMKNEICQVQFSILKIWKLKTEQAKTLFLEFVNCNTIKLTEVIEVNLLFPVRCSVFFMI